MNAISDGGEEGLVREEDEAPTKETGNRFEFTVARGGGKVAATVARVPENCGVGAIYRGFINSNSVPDSLCPRFVFSTWIVIDSRR